MEHSSLLHRGDYPRRDMRLPLGAKMELQWRIGGPLMNRVTVAEEALTLNYRSKKG